MKTVHWYLIIVLFWIWTFWFTYALSEARIISQSLPGYFVPLGGLGLLLVTSIFAFFEGSWSTVNNVFKRSLDGRHSPFYWIVALLPATFLFISMAVYARVVHPDGLMFNIPLSFALIAGILFAWIEEIAWRGYALPRLLKLHSPAKASAILALTWVIFHFPLYLIPNYNAWGEIGWLAWVPWYIIYTYFLTWLAVRTRCSVLIATFSHFVVNWVIAWYAPAFMENIAALGGSIMLLGLVVYLFSKNNFIEKRNAI